MREYGTSALGLTIGNATVRGQTQDMAAGRIGPPCKTPWAKCNGQRKGTTLRNARSRSRELKGPGHEFERQRGRIRNKTLPP